VILQPYARRTDSGITSTQGLQQCNIADNVLVTVQKNLYALKDFLDRNPHLFHSSPGEPTASRTPAGHEQEAWKVCFGVKIEFFWFKTHLKPFYTQAEQRSVAQLQGLLIRVIEAISFVLLLNDYKLGDLIAK
jgi:nuclear pore complex protein Nup155